MGDNGQRDRDNDGPSLGRYMETRLNLLNEAVHGIEKRLEEKITEADRRYEQRFDAQMEAIHKADSAQEKRFESVNEFRKLVDGIVKELISRVEVDHLFESLVEKVNSTNSRVEAAEKRLNLGQGMQEGGKANADERRESFNSMWAVVGSIAAIIVALLSLFLRNGP